ncbi:venom allergen 5-like [Haemaphysalis longicornis]
MNPSLHLSAALWLACLVAPTVQECRDEYKKIPGHTACKPPNAACTIYKRSLSMTEREEVLKLHNDLRSKVAKGNLPGFPPAKDMTQLLWDEEIASVAQALAEQCTGPGGNLKHDQQAERATTAFNHTGQNLAWDGSSVSLDAAGPDWKGQVNNWFDEYKLLKNNEKSVVSRFSGAAINAGHFTQVVWAKTHYLGCGYVYYTVTGARYAHMRYYVCNYAEAGNVNQRPVYQEGDACSACPSGTECVKDTGLCASPEAANGHCSSGGGIVVTVLAVFIALQQAQ